MKCRKQFKHHKLPIASLWEVHLDEIMWKRLCNAAEYRKCSVSWITRYCVFRLAMKRCLKMRNAMKIHSNTVKSKHYHRKKYHRHILCLYGHDEKLLRLAAMQLGITVSHLIRMSLYWFLPKIENQQIGWHQIYYHGTKVCRFLEFNRRNMLKMPYLENLFYVKWPVEKWWKRPRITIPIPYTPENLDNDFYKYFQHPESNDPQ